MGHLKRFGDKFRIQYDGLPKDGKRTHVRQTLTGVNKKQAEAILAEREAAIRKQRKAMELGEVVKDDILLGELFERFMNSKRTTKESTTLARYDSLVKHYLAPRFGSMKAGALRTFHLTDAYSDWQRNGRDGKPISARTVRHARELLRNILNFGVRTELLSRNVAALIADDDLPKAIKPKPTALTDAELRKLLQAARNPSNRSKSRRYLSAQPWFYPAVAFAAYTGARRGEILALRWSDVNFE